MSVMISEISPRGFGTYGNHTVSIMIPYDKIMVYLTRKA